MALGLAGPRDVLAKLEHNYSVLEVHIMYLHEDSARHFRENVVGFIWDTDRL